MAALDAAAKTAVADAMAAGKTFVGQVQAVAGKVEAGTESLPAGGAEIISDAATDMTTLVSDWGGVATGLVTSAMSDVSIPLLSEQQNVAATTLVQQAAQQGVTIVDTDATTLISMAEAAVASEVKSLVAKL